jgi:hypothetical protein
LTVITAWLVAEVCVEVPVADPLGATLPGLSVIDAPFTLAESKVMMRPEVVSLLLTVHWTVQLPFV